MNLCWQLETGRRRAEHDEHERGDHRANVDVVVKLLVSRLHMSMIREERGGEREKLFISCQSNRLSLDHYLILQTHERVLPSASV